MCLGAVAAPSGQRGTRQPLPKSLLWLPASASPWVALQSICGWHWCGLVSCDFYLEVSLAPALCDL